MNSKQRPLDLKKLDFDGNRRRKRRRLLLWSLPAVLALTLGALWLMLPFIAIPQASAANESRSYDTAEKWLDTLAYNTVFEPYKQPFNRAIVATNNKQFDKAGDYFRQAIALAPDSQKCFIRVQWVLSSELGGDDAVNRKDYQAAISFYTKALSDITANYNCFEQYPELSLRIATKLADLMKQIREQNQTDTNSQTQNTDNTPTAQQLQQLQQLQQQGQIQKQEDSRGRQYDDTYTGKRW